MYKQLASKSNFLKLFHPVADEIDKLADGGFKLDPTDYLLIRDDEDAKITKKRSQKFAPKNALGAALKYLRICQESGTVNIDIDKLPGDRDIWSKFLNNCTGSEKTIKEFAIDIFETATKVKYAFVKVDLPYIEVPEDAYLNEESAIAYQINRDRAPYLSAIPIQDVLSWEEESGGLAWIKYRWIECLESPLSETIYNYHFFIIDNDSINEFVYENVQVDSDRQITKIWDGSKNRGKGTYRKIENDEMPSRDRAFPHNRGRCPVIKFELPDSLWQANQVYMAQRVMHGMTMNMLHTTANAGFIQKWGKPYLASGGGNQGSVSFSPVPQEVLTEVVQKYAKHMGDESIMMMDSFNFEEVRGDSIDVQSRQIDDMATFIFNTIIYKQSILDASVKAGSSGLSKEFDRESQVLALKANGSKIIGLIQSILKHVARCFPSYSEDAIAGISVEGMNQFNLRPVSATLEVVERLLSLPSDRVPTEVVGESLKQFAIALLENASQEDKQRVIDAIANRHP